MTETLPPARYIGTVDTAKLIRATLKGTFPCVKFSVRSSLYSGGSSIRVRWTDGPTEKAVQSAVGHYCGSTFDGMTDSTNYHNTLVVTETGEMEHVHYSPNHVFTDRALSPEYAARCRALVLAAGGDEHASWNDVMVGDLRVMGSMWGCVRQVAEALAPAEVGRDRPS